MTLYEDNKLQCFAQGGRSEMTALKNNLCVVCHFLICLMHWIMYPQRVIEVDSLHFHPCF